MLELLLPFRAPLNLLCLGAHPDDIEIGCAGTVLRLIEAGRVATVQWVVLSGLGTERASEARACARRLLRRVPEVHVRVAGFRDGFFPSFHSELKEYLEGLKPLHPDLILTHQLEERHQDHRLVGELTWNTFRDHLILEYEVPKYDGLLGAPNVFVPLTEAQRRRKVRTLLSAFPSQRGKRWFTEGTFDALMRLRGMEAGAPSGYAEAFVGRKLRLDFS